MNKVQQMAAAYIQQLGEEIRRQKETTEQFIKEYNECVAAYKEQYPEPNKEGDECQAH